MTSYAAAGTDMSLRCILEFTINYNRVDWHIFLFLHDGHTHFHLYSLRPHTYIHTLKPAQPKKFQDYGAVRLYLDPGSRNRGKQHKYANMI